MNDPVPVPPYRRSLLNPDEAHLLIQRSVVAQFGIVAAQVLHQLDWLLSNIAGQTGAEPDDRRWYLSGDDWTGLFPWYTKDAIKRALKQLKIVGVISVKSSGIGGVNFYTIEYARLDELLAPQPPAKEDLT